MSATPLEPMNLHLSLLHLLVMYRCMKAFFNPQWKSVPSCVAWGIYYLFQVFFAFLPMMPSQLLFIGNIMLVLLISSLSGRGSLMRRCLFSVLVCTVWMLVEIIVILLLEVFGLDGEELWVAGSVISKTCMLILAVIVGWHMQGKLHRDIPLKYFLTVLMIPICSVYLMHHIFLIAFSHKEYAMFAVSASVILLLVSYVVFEVYEWMSKDAQIREKNRLYEQQLELCSRQAKERESLYLEMRRIRHDMKNHLSAIAGMIDACDREGAARYIRELLDDGIAGSSKEVSRSGNIVVDALVNHKFKLCRREGIPLEATVFLPVSLPFQSGHLAILFGNLLENAMEACRKVEAQKRYVRLDASYAKGVLFLTVVNPYNGESRRNREGKFLTLKGDTVHHGFGLASVEQAVADYHGQVEGREEEGVFQVSVVMYGEK